ILALMRLVYDADHPATDLTEAEDRRWVPPEGGWNEDSAGTFTSERDAEQDRWLRYRHVLRERAGRAQLITDYLGYNNWEGTATPNVPGENWASDLILECEAVVEKAEGELTLELSKGPDRFQARFDLAAGTCALVRITGEKSEQLEGPRDSG